jgi:phospholipase/carboxylesterase
MLDCIEIDPPGAVRASAIWLHGLGADGSDFVPVIDQLGLPRDHGIRFLFPNAPVRPVTINNGIAMPAWYDILGVTIADKQDEAGVRASAGQIEALIEREAQRGIGPERIVLAGFSQGGAVALHTGVRHAATLAGIMALSAYLPLAGRLEYEAHAANRRTPIFMAHGSFDPVVPLALGTASRDALAAAGLAVAWHEYPMAHEVCAPQIQDIGRWLAALLL